MRTARCQGPSMGAMVGQDDGGKEEKEPLTVREP